MSCYRCIFFDLDHTLWDYETNSAEALLQLYEQFALTQLGACPFPEFLKIFKGINNALWDLYDLGKIHRDVLRYERFHRVLTAAGIDDYEMSLRFSDGYITQSPQQKNLMPHALETLEYLASKYPLYIITNGFDEIQSTKLIASGIKHYFKKIITSEQAGHRKPAREIFDYALASDSYLAHEAIMIGDNLITDIQGARNAEIDHVYFNPSLTAHPEKVTYEISKLIELTTFL